MVAPEVIRANLVVGGDKNLVHKPFTVAGTEVRRGPSLPACAPSMQAGVDDATQTRCLAQRLDGVEKSAAKAQETMELLLDLTDSVEKKTVSSIVDQFSKGLDGRFREMAAQQVEAQKKADQDRWAQFKELQEMLAHKSPVLFPLQGIPEGCCCQSNSASWKGSGGSGLACGFSSL